MTKNTQANLINDEVLIIENSGEMPEVILHGSLYYLGRDPDGPNIVLAIQDLRRLKQAVVEGYRKIIVRDLTLKNRGKRHYRGLARCIVNWQRLRKFCQREGFDITPVAIEICELLQRFMLGEYEDICAKNRQCCINCSLAELLAFFFQVGFDPSELPSGWQELLCPPENAA